MANQEKSRKPGTPHPIKASEFEDLQKEFTPVSILSKRSPVKLNAVSEASSTPQKNLSQDSTPEAFTSSKRVKFNKVV